MIKNTLTVAVSEDVVWEPDRGGGEQDHQPRRPDCNLHHKSIDFAHWLIKISRILSLVLKSSITILL